MSIPTSLLSFFRTQWADRMTETCVVKRVDSEVFNTTTGSYVVAYDTTFSGECLVRPMGASDAQSGEHQAELRMYQVFLPYDETDFQPDDLIDVTSTSDSYLTGRQFVVRNVPGDTYNTVRKLVCEEVVDG